MNLWVFVVLFYFIPLIITYFFARKMIIEDERNADSKDVGVIFTPVFNLVAALLYIIILIEEFIHGENGKKLLNKFFFLK